MINSGAADFNSEAFFAECAKRRKWISYTVTNGRLEHKLGIGENLSMESFTNRNAVCMVFATKVAIPAGKLVFCQAQAIDFPIRHQARATATDDFPEFDRNSSLPCTLETGKSLSQAV